MGPQIRTTQKISLIKSGHQGKNEIWVCLGSERRGFVIKSWITLTHIKCTPVKFILSFYSRKILAVILDEDPNNVEM